MSEPRKILVVDDEPGLRATLAASLELEGYVISEAADGVQAVDLAHRELFDLVLTDVKMPRMSGLETLRAIRGIRPDLAVIMMTAFAMERSVEQALVEGAFTLVNKPFAMDRLTRIIARALTAPVVLVVDDVEGAASSTVEVLRASGLRAEAAFDGREALRIAEEKTVDVCVLDLVMPGEDGLVVLDKMRRAVPSVSAIGVTGYKVPEMIREFVSRGGYTCLRKPVDPRDLILAIARLRSDPGRAS